MTVVVTDGFSMASDGLITHHDTIVALDARKIVVLRDGSLLGTAGDTLIGQMIADWLNAPTRKHGDYPESEATTALHLQINGRLALYSCKAKGRPIEVNPPYAIGSGMDFALAAMDMGATVAQAVAVAIKRDPFCGGEICIEALHL